MNILFLDQYSDFGGAQQVLLEFLPAIRERGWRVLVGLPGNGKLFDAIRALGLEAERCDSSPAQIRAFADRLPADLVYLNGPRLVPAAALAGLRCPVVFHSHSRISSGLARILTGLALRRMNAQVVANCEFVAREWRHFVCPERISVVMNGVAGTDCVPRRRPNGPLTVGCIGRISPEKGQREFVAVAARIHKSLPECRFVVWGEALFGNPRARRYAEDLRRRAAGLPIEFRGWASDVYAALAELDLLLVPSVGPEATTRVILEAFAAGVPVIAFGTGGIPEVMENGATGVLTRSVEEMAREAVALLTDGPERRISMARAARREWEQRFTLAKFHYALLRLIERHQRQPLAAVVTSEIA